MLEMSILGAYYSTHIWKFWENEKFFDTTTVRQSDRDHFEHFVRR